MKVRSERHASADLLLEKNRST